MSTRYFNLQQLVLCNVAVVLQVRSSYRCGCPIRNVCHAFLKGFSCDKCRVSLSQGVLMHTHITNYLCEQARNLSSIPVAVANKFVYYQEYMCSCGCDHHRG